MIIYWCGNYLSLPRRARFLGRSWVSELQRNPVRSKCLEWRMHSRGLGWPRGGRAGVDAHSWAAQGLWIQQLWWELPNSCPVRCKGGRGAPAGCREGCLWPGRERMCFPCQLEGISEMPISQNEWWLVTLKLFRSMVPSDQEVRIIASAFLCPMADKCTKDFRQLFLSPFLVYPFGFFQCWELNPGPCTC